ncbi:hypothetical protein [Caballeronia sp.]|uniref:hypothetical protein n=1 Tax=Caballeronia sp. TaxID=1931223 RepID=UPI003C584032
MNERKAIVPVGMEGVYEKIRYAPAVRAGNPTSDISALIDKNRSVDSSGSYLLYVL